jgi:anthranilate phosphoribosyltransferase
MAARGRTALVFRGDDGLDELTTTGTSQIWQVSGGEVREFTLDPSELGIARASMVDLEGGDAEFNANVAKLVLSGGNEPATARVREIVALNAAGGLVAYRLAKNPTQAEVSIVERFRDALEEVTSALDDGRAAAKLQQWIQTTQN